MARGLIQPNISMRKDWPSRLRSPDNRQFHGAFWELYLHECLIRLGYSVTLHPELELTTRRPDFLAKRESEAFYLEARSASEPDDEITAGRRRGRVYDALNRLESRNFFLWVDVDGEGATDLPTRPFRKRLEQWLATLDPDDVKQRMEAAGGVDGVEPFKWRSGDWQLVFRPIPKAVDSRGTADLRPVGVFGPGEASIIDNATPLRRALGDKGAAYGRSVCHTLSRSERQSCRRTSSMC